MTAPNRVHALKPVLDAQDAVFEPCYQLVRAGDTYALSVGWDRREDRWSELLGGLIAERAADPCCTTGATDWHRAARYHARREACDEEQEVLVGRAFAFVALAAAALRPLSSAIEALRAWAAETLGLRRGKEECA